MRCRYLSTLQYISDIHLERRTSFPRIPIISKNVALLGDIGNPFTELFDEFLRYVSYNAERVFFVAGNHEFWHHKRSQVAVHNQLSSICANFSNIEHLSNTSTSLDNYKILGTTLWVPHYETQYKENVDWLTKNIGAISNREEKFIVLSHYLPSYKLIVPKYWTKEYQDLQGQYASDLEHLMRDNVKFWLCGHSHSTNETFINGVFCGINAYGHTKWKSDLDTIRYVNLK